MLKNIQEGMRRKKDEKKEGFADKLERLVEKSLQLVFKVRCLHSHVRAKAKVWLNLHINYNRIYYIATRVVKK